MALPALTSCPTYPQYELRDEPSEREKIVAEAERRLRCGLITANKPVPFERGWAGADVKQVPKVLLYEDEERVEMVRELFYQKTLQLWFEYFRAVSNPTQVYEQGNRMIHELQIALELDQNFQNGGPPEDPCIPPDPKNGLVTFYGLTRNAIVELAENRVLALVVYEFRYYETHFGADC